MRSSTWMGRSPRQTAARSSTVAIADKATVTGYHFGMPGAGTIKKDGKGYALRARQGLKLHGAEHHARTSPPLR